MNFFTFYWGKCGKYANGEGQCINSGWALTDNYPSMFFVCSSSEWRKYHSVGHELACFFNTSLHLTGKQSHEEGWDSMWQSSNPRQNLFTTCSITLTKPCHFLIQQKLPLWIKPLLQINQQLLSRAEQANSEQRKVGWMGIEEVGD